MRGIKIPSFMLPDKIVIEDYGGNTAYGASWGAPRQVKARVEPTNRLVIDRSGNNARAEATVFIRPEDGPVQVESKVVWGGKEYRVLAAGALPDEVRPTHRELTIG